MIKNNPTEKIKEIEREIKEFELEKSRDLVEERGEVEACLMELKAQLQVYKEWEQREKEILEITDGLSRVMLLPHNKERVIAIKLKELLKVIGEKK